MGNMGDSGCSKPDGPHGSTLTCDLDDGTESAMPRDVQLSKVIKLDVGGCAFTTTRSTLTNGRSAMLGVMFSGHVPLTCTADGAYFIDRDGTHFSFVLDFLRIGSCPRLPATAADLQQLLEEAEFYQVPDLEEAIRQRPVLRQHLRHVAAFAAADGPLFRRAARLLLDTAFPVPPPDTDPCASSADLSSLNEEVWVEVYTLRDNTIPNIPEVPLSATWAPIRPWQINPTGLVQPPPLHPPQPPQPPPQLRHQNPLESIHPSGFRPQEPQNAWDSPVPWTTLASTPQGPPTAGLRRVKAVPDPYASLKGDGYHLGSAPLHLHFQPECKVLARQAPAVAHLLTVELGMASVTWHQDSATSACATTLYKLRLQD